MMYYERLPETSFLNEYRKRSFLLGKDIYVLGGVLPDGGHQSNPRLAHADYIDEQLRLVVTYPEKSAPGWRSKRTDCQPF